MVGPCEQVLSKLGVLHNDGYEKIILLLNCLMIFEILKHVIVGDAEIYIIICNRQSTPTRPGKVVSDTHNSQDQENVKGVPFLHCNFFYQPTCYSTQRRYIQEFTMFT